ncbi:hypothetical protein ACN24K_30045 [Streptomyces microflavus]
MVTVSALSTQEAAALDHLGFRWTHPEQQADLIAAVERFHAAHGHTDIPQDFKDLDTQARPAQWLASVVRGERRLGRAEAT